MRALLRLVLVSAAAAASSGLAACGGRVISTGEIVKDHPPTIDVPDYGTFALGDRIEVEGGFVLEHSSDDVQSGTYEVPGVTVPAACVKHDIFVAH